MMDNYKARREEVLRIYDEYLPFKNKYGNTVSKEKEESRAKNIREGKFYLMVAGEAKSGKSTFINAFLGTEILPMDVQQCTSALIKIGYGENPYLEAFDASGKAIVKEKKEEIEEFLKKHGSLKDTDQKIPVTAINDLLIRSKGKVEKSDIERFINTVKDENTYDLEMSKYEELIEDYIDRKKHFWEDIVTEITILYPFSEELKDVTIIDSPGILASGMVGEITENNIGKMDAVIFVKPLTGQALESNAFKKFFRSSANERINSSLLLVLTGKAGLNPQDVETLQREAGDMYDNIPKYQIASVDSKLQLFCNICADKTEEEIEEFLDKAGFDSAENRWYKTSKRVRKDFLHILKKDSNFTQVHEMLEKFGRKAQIEQLIDFLNLVRQGYEVIEKNLKEERSVIEGSKTPEEVHDKVEKKKEEIDAIETKMHQGLDSIRKKYIDEESSLIEEKAKKAFEAYRQSLNSIASIDDLKKKAIRIDKEFNSFYGELMGGIIKDCNASLVEIADVTSVPAESFIPVFTEEDFEKLKTDTKSGSRSYQPRVTWGWDWFQDFCNGVADFFAGEDWVYSEGKHIANISKKIIDELQIKTSEIIGSLQSHATELLKDYKEELSKNFKQKQREYDELCNELKTAEDMQRKNETITVDLAVIKDTVKHIGEIAGGL